MLRRMMMIVLMLGVALPAAAQTKAPAKKAAASAFNRALLQPALLKAKAPETYDVKFTTTKGDFVVRVTRAWAPLGSDRFYNLVKNGFYDKCSLFRVVPGFVVQFGIGAYPQVNAAWVNANIKDDPVKASNKRGFISFATGGPNTRTTQVFINLGDNVRLDSMGFSPFGEVVEGMDVVGQLYSGYTEQPTGRQGEIMQGGKAWLDKNFPKLDSITTARVIAPETAPAAPKPAAKTPAKKSP